MDLHHIFAGKAAGRAHQQHQHLIETPALLIVHMAVHNPVRPPLLTTRTLHDSPARRFRIRPGETDHGDAALSWGHCRGHRRNRVGAGHSSRCLLTHT